MLLSSLFSSLSPCSSAQERLLFSTSASTGCLHSCDYKDECHLSNMSAAFSMLLRMRYSFAIGSRSGFSSACFTIPMPVQCFLGMRFIMLRMKCTWQYSHADSGKHIRTAPLIPVCPSDITRPGMPNHLSFSDSNNPS